MKQILGVVKQDTVTGKYQLEVNGVVVSKSGDRTYWEYHLFDKKDASAKLMSLGITNLVYEDEMAAHAKTAVTTAIDAIAHGDEDTPAPSFEAFNVNERFDILTSYVTMVAMKNSASTIITGPGGLGKTFTVFKALTEAGLQQSPEKLQLSNPNLPYLDEDNLSIDEMMELEKWREVEKLRKNGYIFVKGYSSAKGLFRTLYENRHSLIVFDDCDEVLKDSTAADLLKAALDSYQERWVSWNVEGGNSDLPKRFRFEGAIVFISNMAMVKIPQALRSRSLPVDVSMTSRELIERMYRILENPDFQPEYDYELKLEALKFLDKAVELPQVKEVNLRSLINTIKIRAANPNNAKWERLALYALLNAAPVK